MRTLLTASCTMCDFRHEGVKFGAPSMDDTPMIPALDQETGEFVVTEYDGDAALSYYHEFGMNRGKEGPHWIESYGIFLSPDHNKCPKCGEYAMRFEPAGTWE